MPWIKYGDRYVNCCVEQQDDITALSPEQTRDRVGPSGLLGWSVGSLSIKPASPHAFICFLMLIPPCQNETANALKKRVGVCRKFQFEGKTENWVSEIQ